MKRTATLLAAAIAAFWSGWALSDDEPEPPKPSATEEQLDRELEDFLGTEVPSAPSRQKEKPPPQAGQEEEELSLEEANKRLQGDEKKEEEENPLVILERVIDYMGQAYEHLGKATAWRGVETQGRAADEIEKLIPEVEAEQEKAAEELRKLFDSCSGKQIYATREIERLIKLAKETSCSDPNCAQCRAEAERARREQARPQQMTPQPGNPAKQPYEPPRTMPPPNTNPLTRTGDPNRRWGDLPSKIREELLQSGVDQFLQEYKDRLERYFRILGEGE